VSRNKLHAKKLPFDGTQVEVTRGAVILSFAILPYLIVLCEFARSTVLIPKKHFHGGKYGQYQCSIPAESRPKWDSHWSHLWLDGIRVDSYLLCFRHS
jgi:hypothetical protein